MYFIENMREFIPSYLLQKIERKSINSHRSLSNLTFYSVAPLFNMSIYPNARGGVGEGVGGGCGGGVGVSGWRGG